MDKNSHKTPSQNSQLPSWNLKLGLPAYDTYVHAQHLKLTLRSDKQLHFSLAKGYQLFTVHCAQNWHLLLCWHLIHSIHYIQHLCHIKFCLQSKQYIHILQWNTKTAMQLTLQYASQFFESINYGKIHNSWINCLKVVVVTPVVSL